MCLFGLMQSKKGWTWLVTFGSFRSPDLINYEACRCACTKLEIYEYMYIDIQINLLKIKVRDDIGEL